MKNLLSFKICFIFFLGITGFINLNGMESSCRTKFSWNNNIQSYSNEKTDYNKFNELSLYNTKENSVKNGYYKLEKIVFSIGILNYAVGLPLLLFGIINYLTPHQNYSSITVNEANYFTSAGAMFTIIGTGLNVFGTISISIKLKKIRNKMDSEYK